MKVFMSWSGQRSKAVAELLAWWTRCVIQASRPWISTEDVDRGALWFTTITDGLAETAVGIVCLTHENKNKPWILFEAGALAKGLSNSRVCTFLVDLEPKDIQDPLAQFNHTLPTEDDMRRLARTLNNNLGAGKLDDNVLSDAFGAYWPTFKQRFDDILKSNPQVGPVEVRTKDDLLEEILEGVRGMTQRIRKLEIGAQFDEPSLSRETFQQTRRLREQRVHLREIIRQSLMGGLPMDAFLSQAEAHGMDEASMTHFIADVMANMPELAAPRKKSNGSERIAAAQERIARGE